VSFLWSTLGGFVAPLVAKAAERHPEIELSIAQAVFLDILPALRRGTADVVIARPTFAEHELVEETLASEPSLLAISERDPLAAREEFSVEELPGLPMVALERRLVPTAYDGAIDRSRAAGLEPWIVRHARSPTEALALVSAGVGVYRLPASAATPMPGVVYRELVGAPSRLTILHRPFPSAATQAIIELVWELYGDAPRASQNAGSALDQALASS
jgi:DNA-binding transcriptional LysR family regulator